MQTTLPRRMALVLPLLLLAPCSLFAWSNKEHIQMTRLAAADLIANPDTPPAMKDWLRDATPGLTDMEAEGRWFLRQRVGLFPRAADGLPYWATIPDMVAISEKPDHKIEPYGTGEGKLHYIDVELFQPDPNHRVYRHDLSSRPKLSDFPRNLRDPRYQQAGFLPFRVEECQRRLMESIRAKRLTDTPGQYPRDDHAAMWAGYLAHYAQDNTQPHHATLDYKSRSYFVDPRTAPNVHNEMEYVLADDDGDDHMALRQEYWPLLIKMLAETTNPVESDDPWQSTIEVALKSYEALPLIGQAAMRAAGQKGDPQQPQAPNSFTNTEAFFHYRGQYLGREMSVLEMKAYQQAWAIRRTQRLWRQAWEKAAPATTAPAAENAD